MQLESSKPDDDSDQELAEMSVVLPDSKAESDEGDRLDGGAGRHGSGDSDQ